MKLNPNCVRDILLTLEDYCGFNTPWEYRKEKAEKYLGGYSQEEILYHISQCHSAGLIEQPHFYDGGDNVLIPDLTPKGHEFLADIRSDSVWNTVKEVSSKVGSNSLSALTQIATGTITALIKNQLGI